MIGQNSNDEAKQINKENKKYILNQNITKDIAIEEYDPKTNILLTIIHDNHKYILFTKNPKEHKKIHINAAYGEDLEIKNQTFLFFVIIL